MPTHFIIRDQFSNSMCPDHILQQSQGVCAQKIWFGDETSQQYKEDAELYNGRYFVDYLG